jgi:nicotinamidase-related amidase
MTRLFGPIPATAVHLVVDMQELFRSHVDWGTPALSEIVPGIERLLRARPERACFSRFIPPELMEHAIGAWQRYYRRWHRVTLDKMDRGLIEIVPELRPWAKWTIDKSGYSALSNAEFRQALLARPDQCLILSGVETDVCILSTVMEAMDLGFRVILAADAMTSSVVQCHDLAIEIMRQRFDEQVEIATVDEIIAAWRGGPEA